jgi:putative glutathione S-transferase
VYTCGFSTSQGAYDAAERALHDGLARCDAILSDSRFLAGDRCGFVWCSVCCDVL